MVVVAIMSIMASSVVLGFNSFEKTIRVRETAGVITDIIKNLELDMLRRDYTRQTVHFNQDYLVSEAENENQTLTLKYDTGCTGGKETLKADNSGSATPVYLAQRDPEGNNLNLSLIPAGTTQTVCVDFLHSKESEWDYQLFSGSDISQTIRFIHFNLRRDDDPSTWARITAGSNYTLQITAPYADKTFYDNGTLTTGTVNLSVTNAEAAETVTLQQ